MERLSLPGSFLERFLLLAEVFELIVWIVCRGNRSRASMASRDRNFLTWTSLPVFSDRLWSAGTGQAGRSIRSLEMH